MNPVEVRNRQQQKHFLSFRKEVYRSTGVYADNNLFMIKEVFNGKTSFSNQKKLHALYVEQEGRILCEAFAVYAMDLPQYIQMCFFESRPECTEAVELLVKQIRMYGEKYHCSRLVIGLSGHVNYGLGMLASHFDEKNSFTSGANPVFYNEYFEYMGFEKTMLNSYFTKTIDERLKRYDAFLRKLSKTFTYRNFDRKKFDEDAALFTDLNNQCFADHKYYYQRGYDEDNEMLKELFLFMKEDSIIYAYHNDRPVGFILWYPDYNELMKAGHAFGPAEFFKNGLFGSHIRTAKVMEYGVIEEYRKAGLPLALIEQVYERLCKYRISQVETSWILADNKDSNSFCEELCDSPYKKYVVYEAEL